MVNFEKTDEIVRGIWENLERRKDLVYIIIQMVEIHARGLQLVDDTREHWRAQEALAEPSKMRTQAVEISSRVKSKDRSTTSRWERGWKGRKGEKRDNEEDKWILEGKRRCSGWNWRQHALAPAIRGGG